MEGKIYSLICPETNIIRYIGQTTQPGLKRFHQHKYQWTRSKNGLSHLNAWIKSLYDKNMVPIFEIIEDNIDKNLLNYKEIEYIKLFKAIGAKLVNTTSGGGFYENFKQSESSIQKRLNTLKSSNKWKNRSKRHSEIIKNKHKEGISKIGFKYISKEKQLEFNKRSSISRQKKVKSIDVFGNISTFNSIKEAAKFFNIKDSTHIVRVCKGKSKSGKTHGLKFYYS